MAHDKSSVEHPAHYTAYQGFEVIDVTEQLNFNRGNAVKYICRAGLKDPDLWYIKREIGRAARRGAAVMAGRGQAWLGKARQARMMRLARCVLALRCIATIHTPSHARRADVTCAIRQRRTSSTAKQEASNE